jgi:O-antigen/teichoic acid export membrane protein
MNDSSRTIVKNASFLMASQLLGWVMALLVTIILPRELGPTAVGKWYLAGTIWSLLSVFITFGTDTLLIKEIARAPEKSGGLFLTSVIIRLALYVAAVGFLIVFLRLASYPEETAYLILLFGISQCVWTISGVAQATLEGLERMEYIALANFVGKMVSTLVTILVIYLGYGVLVLAVVSILPPLIILAIQIKGLKRYAKFIWHVDFPQVTSMLKGGVPYFASTIFLVIYAQVDVLLLSLLTNEETLGWYFAAENLVGALMIIPAIIMQAIFPVMARMHVHSDDVPAPRLVSRSFNLLFLCAVPVGLGVFIVANPLVRFLYGPSFINSGPILAITGIALIFMYQNILMGRYLVSADRQNTWTVVMAVATLISVPISWALVTWCATTFGNGGIGGALTFVITEAGMFIAALVLIPRGTLSRSDLFINIRVLIAGVAMVIVTWFLRELFIAIPIVIGAFTYGATVLILRAVPKENIVLIRELSRLAFRRFQNRIAPALGLGGRS